MKKYTIIVAILLVVHTIEEIIFLFWKSDYYTPIIAKLFGLSPVVAYFLLQILLAVILIIILLKKETPKSMYLYFFPAIILVLELTHIVEALNKHTYTAGLITSVPLVLFIVPYWFKLLKSLNYQNV
jgi:hypothetical protein